MNLLLTSAGRRTYLVEYFKKVIDGKVFASNSQLSPALYTADDYVITPLIYDDNYIPFLLEYVKKNDIDIIISLFDIDLPILAKHKHKFKEVGVEVIVSDYEVTQICNDKWKTYNYLIDNGLNSPVTYISLKKALAGIEKKEIKFPLIIKPRWGMGSIGIYKALNELELKVFYEKVKHEVNSSYLQFESKNNLNKSVLIQECIEGQEYGVDVFNDLKGNYIKTFVKKKTAMRSGETDGAVTVNDQEIQELSHKLANKLKHIGNLDSDWFVTEDKVYVLEMNCRFGGGYPFTHLAGANLPKVIIDMIRTNKYDNSDLEIEFGIEMIKDIQPVKIKRDGSVN